MPLPASEIAFNQTLDKGARDLSQSQGQAWVDAVRADEARLSELQGLLIQMDSQRRAGLDELAQQRRA